VAISKRIYFSGGNALIPNPSPNGRREQKKVGSFEIKKNQVN